MSISTTNSWLAIAKTGLPSSNEASPQKTTQPVVTQQSTTPRLGNMDLRIGNLSQVRFSQTSISPRLTDQSTSLEQLAASWDPNKSKLIFVRMPDGQLTSVNNRRLHVLKTEGLPATTCVKVEVISHKDPCPQALWTSILNEYCSGSNGRRPTGWRPPSHPNLQEKSYGHAIFLRMKLDKQIDINTYGFETTAVRSPSSPTLQVIFCNRCKILI